MRILIITQKVDMHDQMLGFFHGWLAEFSRQFDSVKVICLEKGAVDLPPNVEVFSLGKEQRQSRIRYMLMFYKYLWQLRGQYTNVFIHMNQEYLFLAGLWWRLTGKKVFLWRNHPAGTYLTNIAVVLADKVFCTSPFSYTARFKKTEIMPAGVDMNLFHPIAKQHRDPQSVLFFGRVSPVKRPEVFIDAVKILKEKHILVRARIVGDPTKNDIAYAERLKEHVQNEQLNSVLSFERGIQHAQSPELYSSCNIYVNTTDTGSFDKTIIEAIACGAIPLTSNQAYIYILGPELTFPVGDAAELAEKIHGVLEWSEQKRNETAEKLRIYVEKNQGLVMLISTIRKLYEKS